MEIYKNMTFDEMQLIMQSVVISQREMQATLSETQLLAKSIARGVQAMQDKALSDDLKRDEEKAEHQARMEKLERISEGLINMLDVIDSDRPTILRKLTTIENKTDAIIERLSRG
jgi:isochorismate synthase EntC